MLSRIQANATRQNLSNVKAVLGTQSDSGLPARSLDYLLMVDVYHDLS
jgi:hypothetical protein